MKKTTQKITRHSTLGEIKKIKGAEEILVKYGVPCLGCPLAQLESSFLKLGEVCERYGLDEKKLLIELKKLKEK